MYNQQDNTEVSITKDNQFGPLLRYKPDECLLITFPSKSMKKNTIKGELKKEVVAKLRDLNVGNIMSLNQKYGITFERVNETLTPEKLLGGTVA